MDVRLLGPVEVWAAGKQLTLGPRKQRCVLAVLAMSPGQPISTEELIDRVWGDNPPRNPQNALYTNLSRLRGVLAPAGGGLRRADSGYVLQVDQDDIDLGQARRLAAEARKLSYGRTSGVPQAIEHLQEAEALWRGAPLADLKGDWVDRVRLALGQERLAITTERLELELRAGRHTSALGPLTALQAEHPLAETIAALLMRAYYAAGHRPEALAVYARTRQRLVETLGVEPGSALRELHQQILRGDLERPEPPRPAPVGGDIPAQLPREVSSFSGRERQVQQLDELAGDRSSSTAAVTIIAVEGPAGVGKTTLVVHWAHRAANQFPDGQLYVDLRGYASGAPLPPIDALVRFLHALGTPVERVPARLEEAAALYRSQLAGRQMLVVLDNAASPEQVRPLLPGGGGSTVLVTSRDQLTGLVARDGAHRLSLDVLTPEGAQTMLARVLGNERVRAEPAAAAELARLCGYLPLALRIAAANLTAHPRHSIARHADQLRDHDRLAALSVLGDEESSVSTAFDHSYARLPEPARRMFRLLGLIPGPDTTADCAAALAGIDLGQAQALMERLVSAHLVQERLPDRYTLHDLLRRYAADRVDQLETGTARSAARQRLYSYYLSRTDAAARSAYPALVRLPQQPATAVTMPAANGFADAAAARQWLDAERDNLVAAVCRAVPELEPWAWRIADDLRGYFWLRIDVAQWPVTARAALAAAQRRRDRYAEAAARLSLAVFYSRAGAGEPADEAGRALAAARAAGWGVGQAAALHTMGAAHQSAGRLDAAADCFRQALALLEHAGERASIAAALGNLTIVSCLTGHLAAAAGHARQALALSQESGSRNGEAVNRLTLGEISRWRGQLVQAGDHLTRSRDLFQLVGNTNGESLCLGNLAAVHRDAGRYGLAAETAAAAVELACDSGDGIAEASCRAILASVQIRLGLAGSALVESRRAVAVAGRVASRHEEAEALTSLAVAHRQLGELDRAGEHARRALDLTRQAGFRLLEAQALAELAAVELAIGESGRAGSFGKEALAVHREVGNPLGEARMHLLLGHLSDRAGGNGAAHRYRRRAHTLFTAVGAPAADEAAALGLVQHSPAGVVQPWS